MGFHKGYLKGSIREFLECTCKIVGLVTRDISRATMVLNIFNPN